MSLKERLEERVQQCMVYPNCENQRQRIAFYVWNQADLVADRFCTRLGGLANGDARAVFAQNPEDFQKILAGSWRECLDKIHARELSCPQGIYVMVVASSSVFLRNMEVFFPDCVVEFCHLIDGMEAREALPDTLDGFASCVEWRMDPENVKAAAALLFYVAFSPELLRSGFDMSAKVFRVKYAEYNAVRESISRFFLRLLGRRLQPSGCGIEEISSLIQELCAREKKNQFPGVRDLPVVGYENLKEALRNQFSWRFSSLLQRGGNQIETDLSVREVLSVLYGETDGLVSTEWFRKEAAARDMAVSGKKIVKQNKEMIEKEIRKYFSLYDICNTLAGELRKAGNRSKVARDLVQKKLDEIMDRLFMSESLKLGHIFQGLSSYYQEWEKYIELSLEYGCWEAAAGMVQDLRMETNASCQELRIAENVFLNSQIQDWKPKILTEESFYEESSITGIEALETCMKEHMSCAVFCSDNISELIYFRDKALQNSSDRNVDDMMHPKIHLIFQESLAPVDLDGRDAPYFDWIQHPVPYISQSLVIELRLYKEG